MKTFSGIFPTLMTPYNHDLSVDEGAYRVMLDWYLRLGVGGLYANCLSSEMYLLDMAERLRLVSLALEAAEGVVPVAATGNFGDSLREHIESCRRVADTGADVVMLTVPHFLNTEYELEHYYLSIAAEVDAPLGLYECPVPRSYHLSPALVGRLAHSGRFHAYKETSEDLWRIKEHLAACAGTPLAMLQADTFLMLDALRAGAAGSMTIAAIWVPDLAAMVLEKEHSGDPSAERLHGQLCAMKLAQRLVHPWGTRYLLGKRRLPMGTHCRSNLSPPPDDVIMGLDYAARHWFDEEGGLLQRE